MKRAIAKRGMDAANEVLTTDRYSIIVVLHWVGNTWINREK